MTAATATSTASTTAAPAKVAKALQLLGDIAEQIRQVDEQKLHVDSSLKTESLRLGDRKLNLVISAYQAMMDRDQTTSTKVVEADFREWCVECLNMNESTAREYSINARLVLDQLQEFAPTSVSPEPGLSMGKLRHIQRLKDASGKIPKATINEFTRWCATEHGNAMPQEKDVRAWVNARVGPPKPKAASWLDDDRPPTLEGRLAAVPRLTGANLLGLGYGATPDVIEIVAKVFRQRYHPDKGGDAVTYFLVNQAIEEAQQ